MTTVPLRVVGTEVPRVLDDWYVLASSRELRSRPLARELHGTPVALFRDERGRAAALVDRCPHRNVPLSAGRVEGGSLECSYHGWRFAADGRCVRVPGLAGEADHRTRRCGTYAVREQDGFVWVWATPGDAPTREPFRFVLLDDPRYASVRQTMEMAGTVHAAAENALDVPHTAFLHRGLFRGAGKTNELEVRVRRHHDHVEAEYIGEPRPSGALGWALAPQGGVVEHFDRFFLPSIAQVEYRLGESHVVATVAFTPRTDRRTVMNAVVSYRLPFIPSRLAQLAGELLRPLGLSVLRQDTAILARQDETIARFGEARFVSTELDAIGPQIAKLLRTAARGREAPSDAVDERTFRMRV